MDGKEKTSHGTKMQSENAGYKVTDKNKNVQDKKESFKINTNRLIEQRPRSTGFRTFLNWFKKVENLQRTVQEESSSLSDSSDDRSSTSSTATVASFSFLPANIYKPYGDASQPEKFITPGPYTETYHRLISERNRRRSMDKNLSLRKKYSLYSSGTLTGKLKSSDENNAADSDDAVKVYDTFSLPTIAKSGNDDMKKYSDSRRTASLSSRDSKTGTSCHVKGKRRAPPPPTTVEFTKSYRKKRQAPKPPSQIANGDSENKILEKKCDGIKLNISDDKSENVVKKDTDKVLHVDLEKCVSTVQSELSPKPWYKRQISENKSKSKSNKTDSSRKKSKHEYPEVGFFRCSRIFENKKVINSDKSEGDLKQEKRASCLLPNISELDREAAEIIKHHKQDVQNNRNQPTDENVSFVNKPSSARDLINKFNAITNASKNSSSSASAILPWAPEQQKIFNSPNQLKKSNEDINDLNSRTNDIEFIDKGKTPEKDLKPGYFNNILYKKNESDNDNTNNLKNEEKLCDKMKHDNIDPLAKEDFSQSFQAAVFSALPDLNYIPTSDKEDTEKIDPEMKKKVIDAQEKKKLRELLKEMKNSLPKKPKPESKKDSTDEVIAQISPIFLKNDTKLVTASDEFKQSAITNSESEITNLKLNKEPSQKQSFSIEDLHTKPETKSDEQSKNGIVNRNLPSNAIKAQNSQQEIYGNSNKVSSSAQTGCMVKRYDQILGPSKKAEVKPVALVTETKTNAVYTNLDESKQTSSIDPVKLFQSDENTRILLKKLETAIAEGDDSMAAKLAKDLAILKVNCSVIGAPHKPTQDTTIKKVQIYIEDQISHQGPIPLRVDEKMTIAELKRRIENELHIPIPVQRWIIGKQLTTDDSLQLQHYNGKDFDVPLFLYVVAPEKKVEEKVEIVIEVKKNVNETKEITKKLVATIDDIKPLALKIVKSDAGTQNDVKIVEKILNKKYAAPKATTSVVLKDVIKNTWICTACTLINSLLSPLCSACGSKKINGSEKVEKVEPPMPVKKEVKNHYLQLVNLDGGDLAPNVEQFECPICFMDCPPHAGVLLRDCLHSFCRECLANTVKYSEEAEIKCPFRDKNYYCDSVIQEREIKALVDKAVYEQHLAKSVAFAENKMKNTFHCKSPDCKGWCIFEENVNDFRCPVCKKINCLTCQAIHEGKNCKEYQDFLVSEEASTSNEGQQTKAMLDEMVSRGEALICPSCNVILMKKWGCDWLRCSMCKTEICWVTRGPRWGPAGKGDNSGGCQCGVNGIKCHPKCNYCH